MRARRASRMPKGTAKAEYDLFEISRRAYKEPIGKTNNIKQLEQAAKDLKQRERGGKMTVELVRVQGIKRMECLLYQSEDGQVKLEVYLQNETWKLK